jgi:CheY-like chemotaxis protein
MNRDMLSRRLTRKGFKVTWATNGLLGVEEGLANPPDLILMDLGMPVLDGWEAARRLRSEDRTKQIPIIALTAHAMETDRLKALECGFSAFATKPIDFERLLQMMHEFLSTSAKQT